MKSDIQLYPDFIKALKENDIVYLFGAGFSTALSGRKYTWWDWISLVSLSEIWILQEISKIFNYGKEL